MNFNKFNQFVADMANGVHNLGSNALYVALSNVAPVATNTVFANITEIAAGNGYTAGGQAVTVSSSTQTSGLYKLIGSVPNPTWTATGGSMATFRYQILYNSTPATPLKPLIGWWDYGSAVALTVGQSYLLSLDAINGILQDS